MDSDELNRIALVVTVVGCLYVFARLTAVYGWVGLFGTVLSLSVIATAFLLWARLRGGERSG